MAQLRFSALPVHVRTARLVAVAMARRAGVEEAVLDEVRLAVGEACSRAVGLHQRSCPDELVTVTFLEEPGRFMVTVADRVGGVTDPGAPDAGVPGELPPDIGLAVIEGLVDDLVVEPAAAGGSVRMSWPHQGGLAPIEPAP